MTVAQTTELFKTYTISADGVTYGADQTDLDGTIPVTGTNVYRSQPHILVNDNDRAGTRPVYFKSTVATGAVKVYGTLDSAESIHLGTATWVLLTAATVAIGGTAITFTAGNGAIGAPLESIFGLTATVGGLTAVRFEYTNATGTGTLRMQMRN